MSSSGAASSTLLFSNVGALEFAVRDHQSPTCGTTRRPEAVAVAAAGELSQERRGSRSGDEKSIEIVIGFFFRVLVK